MLARTRLLFLIVATTAAAGCGAAVAGDWPTWRANAGRTAATSDALPSQLAPAWMRQLPAPRPAWPQSQTKLQFDRSYEPVVAGEKLLVGSMVNDSVTAYSTKTGDELWRFYTDGPVRFAPAVESNRVFAVSDDGYLYCLDLENGELLWKFNGGPADRAIIGNDRLISSWPVRGGVVVSAGVAYFSASIWPSMGIFMHAVDAETGKPIWTNSEIGSHYTVHPHGASAFGSVVPQGYLAVAGDALVVPGGRSLPAVFNRKTGKLNHFDFGGKSSGGYDAMANDQVYLVRNDLCQISDGKTIAQVVASVLDGEMIIGSSGPEGSIQLQTWAGKVAEVEFKDRRGRPQTRIDFTPNKKHTVATTAGGPLQVHFKAGNVVYASGAGQVFAIPVDASSPPTEPVKPSWSAKVEGTVWRMLAADNRLFVVTEEGSITCYSEKADALVTHKLETEPLASGADRWAREAASLLSIEGADEGYCLALGIGSGRLIEELILQSKLRVIAIDADPERVDEFRRSMERRGLYGTRVSAHVGNLRTFAFPPYLANVIVCEDLAAAEFEPTMDVVKKLFHPLRPYGGVAALPMPESDHAAFAATVAQASLGGVEVSRSGHFSLLTRAGALPGSGTWTHQYGNSSNTVVSQDRLVKAPLGLLWFGGPSNDKVLPRHGHGPSPQVAGGRLIIEGPDMLRAVDVYTGRVLWEKELKGVGKYYDITSHFPGAGEIGSNYVTLPDHVYVVYGSEIVELDASTGEQSKSFKLKAGADNKHPYWGYAAVDGDLLVATSSPVAVESPEEKPAPKPAASDHKPLIPQKSQWQYLAGTEPPENWTSPDFAAEGWKTGEAGFGYGHQGNETILRDMRGNYQRVYLRKTFETKEITDASLLALMVDYDDGFIAYLNGTEIARANVKQGSGAKAGIVESHDAGKHETFDIKDFRKLLRDTTNVIAFEGHNKGIGGSDFVLDPYVVAATGPAAVVKSPPKEEKPSPTVPLSSALKDVQYSAASRRIVVYERHTGELLWSREAVYSFRHNCIVLSGNTLFCIDGMTPAKLQSLERRGVKPTAKAKLLALDARTGDEKWSTDQDVFGTFLNYSAQHDVLVQAGSAYRDRAKDEVDKGMVAYRGSDGNVLWKDLELSHGGPCLLWRDKIITNGMGGFQLDLMTGKRTGWTYSRMHGCNTAVGSENLLTFRSGAAGFCDLAGDSGTGNIGGFRSSCTANLIAADGVLNAPDYTRTCVCSYQNQTSLALVHMPEADSWTFNSERDLAAAPLRLGVNLGAPGDRRAADGTLWLEYPSVGGPSPALQIEVSPANPQWFTQHSSAISGDGPAWVAASGARGLDSIKIKLLQNDNKPASYTVRLHFAEPDDVRPGDRVFSVSLQGETVLKDFDIVQTAGGRDRAIVKEFSGIKIDSRLDVALASTNRLSKHPPVLCGVEILAE
ncbi:MAG: PQQ-binding-like beta-propeller repeat protein [Planctomycetaceae bacterium]